MNTQRATNEKKRRDKALGVEVQPTEISTLDALFTQSRCTTPHRRLLKIVILI